MPFYFQTCWTLQLSHFSTVIKVVQSIGKIREKARETGSTIKTHNTQRGHTQPLRGEEGAAAVVLGSCREFSFVILLIHFRGFSNQQLPRTTSASSHTLALTFYELGLPSLTTRGHSGFNEEMTSHRNNYTARELLSLTRSPPWLKFNITHNNAPPWLLNELNSLSERMLSHLQVWSDIFGCYSA